MRLICANFRAPLAPLALAIATACPLLSTACSGADNTSSAPRSEASPEAEAAASGPLDLCSPEVDDLLTDAYQAPVVGPTEVPDDMYPNCVWRRPGAKDFSNELIYIIEMTPSLLEGAGFTTADPEGRASEVCGSALPVLEMEANRNYAAVFFPSSGPIACFADAGRDVLRIQVTNPSGDPAYNLDQDQLADLLPKIAEAVDQPR